MNSTTFHIGKMENLRSGLDWGEMTRGVGGDNVREMIGFNLTSIHQLSCNELSFDQRETVVGHAHKDL